MSIEVAVVLLAVLIIGALVVSAMAHNRHQKALENKRLMQSLKLQESECAESALVIQRLGLPIELTLIFVRYQLALTERRQQIPPASNTIVDEVNLLKTKIAELAKQHNESENHQEDAEPLILDSDKDIKTYQQLIIGAIKQLDQLASSAAITQANHQIFTQRLKWKFVQIEADAYIHKGNWLLENGDKISAVDALRHAKKKLFEFQTSDLKRDELLKKINVMIREIQGDRSANPSAEQFDEEDEASNFEPKKKF